MMLSERLQAVCALCPHGECLVDIGTDHGYVPVTLVEEGIVNRAVAMDVRVPGSCQCEGGRAV